MLYSSLSQAFSGFLWMQLFTWAPLCNMKVLLVGGFLSCPVPPSCLAPKKNHTQISVSYKADWPIRSGYLLANSHILINPFFWSILAMWLSTFFSGAAHILLLQWSGQEWKESTSSSPEFSCSPCIISTSYLVFPPTPPAWPISVYLKHDWQNTDNSPTPLPPLFLKKKQRKISIVHFLGMWAQYSRLLPAGWARW